MTPFQLAVEYREVLDALAFRFDMPTVMAKLEDGMGLNASERYHLKHYVYAQGFAVDHLIGMVEQLDA